MLRALMKKADSVQGHVGNVNREIGILRNNQKKL